MTLKFSACLLPLLALVTLPLLADAAAGDCEKIKKCGGCAAATGGTAGQNCQWCSLQFKKTPTGGTAATFVNSGLGFCFDGACPTASATVASLTKSFPYSDSAKATHALQIEPVLTADCTKNPGASVNAAKDSPLDASKTQCKDCTGNKKWCQFDQYLDGTATPKLYSGKSGGVCLDAVSGTTYSVDCGKFKAMISGGQDITVADVVGTADCAKVDSPPCTADNCQGCITNRCTYCGAVLKTTITPTSGGTTSAYQTKDLGVCAPLGTTCPTSFGTLATATDYTVAAAGSTQTYKIEVKPFGTVTGQAAADCKVTKVDTNVKNKSTCADCVASFDWCNVELSKPSGKVSGGFCTATSAATVCTDFTKAAVTGVYAAAAATTKNCGGAAKSCDTNTKCSDCKAGAGCDWCAAKAGTNDINLGYCVTKGTPTACDKAKFGTLDALSTAAAVAGKAFTVAPATACPSTKDGPLVMASKTCSTCAPSNAWCKLGDGTNSGGVCLKTGATAATHSTDCATLKTSLGMTTDTSVTVAANCGGAAKTCDANTKCSDCKAGAGCDWCAAKVGTKDINLGYCTAKATACDKTKFGTLDALLYFAGEKLDVSLLATKACPAATDSPLETAKDCTTCTADAANKWCQLGKKLGTTGSRVLSSGGVCLNGVGSPTTTCQNLSTDLSMEKDEMTKATANCPKPTCSKKSCDGCLTEGCMWCGVTVDNGEGTALGKCVSMPTTPDNSVCNGQTFGKMKDVLGYKVGSKTYKMEVVPFSLSKGWTEAKCNKDEVDATILPDCKKCIAKKEKWCKVVLTDDKNKRKEGGICLGKNETSGKKICSTFTQAAKKNEAFKRNGTLTTKCDGAVQNSLSLGLLFAGVALSLLSSF